MNKQKFEELQQKVGDLCTLKNWDKDWNTGGCYIHLEVSEFIESLRGKGSSSPVDEAADVLFTLISVLDNYHIEFYQVLEALDSMVEAKLAKALKQLSQPSELETPDNTNQMPS